MPEIAARVRAANAARASIRLAVEESGSPLDDVTHEVDALVLALDVYEHAYFLDFQTKRPAYIDAYMKSVDWSASNALLAKAKGAI